MMNSGDDSVDYLFGFTYPTRMKRQQRLNQRVLYFAEQGEGVNQKLIRWTRDGNVKISVGPTKQ